MKRVLVILLAFALTGCGAISPFITQPTAAATNPPQVVYQTVVVTVLVTSPASETPVPTATWTPIPSFTPQPTMPTSTLGLVATATSGSAQFTATPSALAPSGSATATLPANAGGTIFADLTRSSDRLSYSCSPSTITFGLSATDPNVYEVDLFYRLEYQNSSLTTNWVDVGKMVSDGAGHFTFDFKASMIPSDLRTRAAWLDYQFVGLNRSFEVIGRSARILQQVTFSPSCP
jgi:hypothetical protein